MYTGHGFNQWGMGDVDVVRHGDLYHLFHLVLPNHAYIAHAVSRDGLHWTRIENALFLGDPGSWDDDMLWTMHVSPDPDRAGSWRMFYTGLKRTERGRVQRLGLARSDDLVTWHKEQTQDTGYPLELPGPPYEHSIDQGRHWVSFRDPYFTTLAGERWLLASARVDHGPLIRRGCVALAREVAPDRFEIQDPLYHPRLYDDIEVPNLATLGEYTYLIGSIREDVKVHYWYASDPRGPYQNFSDNVLLPQGNYAARVCRDGERVLVWSFFSTHGPSTPAWFKGLNNMLPPPKELVATSRGELQLKSFSGLDDEITASSRQDDLLPLCHMDDAPDGEQETPSPERFGSESSLAVFRLQGTHRDFRLRGRLSMIGRGKCGLVFRLDEHANGYYLSLDLFKGIAQIRAWGRSTSSDIEEAFVYNQLQATFFLSDRSGSHDFELVAYGQYLEFSLDGRVLLTLADDSYRAGYAGFYTESAWLRVERLSLESFSAPPGEVCQPMG